MNAGDGLLHSPDGAFKKFTFGTYIYVSEWVDGACLFKKADGNTTIIAFQLGATEGNLKLTVGSASATVTNSALKPGAWHYVAVTYDGGTAKLYIDNNAATDFTGSLPASVPNTRADFVMGEKLKGYLDETFVNSLLVGTLGKIPFLLIHGIILKHLLTGNMTMLPNPVRIHIHGLSAWNRSALH